MQLRFLAITLIALALTLSAHAQSPTLIGDGPSDQLGASLLEQEKAFISAEMHGDATPFARLLTDDFVLVDTAGHNVSRAELLGEGELKHYAIYEPKTFVLNDGAVMLSYNAIVGETPSDEDARIPRYQHVTTIWVKQGTDWKMKFHQAAAHRVGS
jgi:hypothetical protein